MPLYRRVPKLKHFPVVSSREYTIINVGRLASLEPGSTVNLEGLRAAGIVTSPRHPLKVLGHGDLAVKLTVEAAAFTASARAKIEAAGGSCALTTG
jgi:large subunit ribosomal protein L15